MKTKTKQPEGMSEDQFCSLLDQIKKKDFLPIAIEERRDNKRLRERFLYMVQIATRLDSALRMMDGRIEHRLSRIRNEGTNIISEMEFLTLLQEGIKKAEVKKMEAPYKILE